ncbi:MAG: type II secretion system protein [Candidatus Borkfalkiaceae bacterium]|nr:type II secretion system protein [Christensenellaceae bacterium]
MKKGTKKGFTLVELVIVIAVIAVLSAIIIPVTGSIVSNAKETVDKTTVKALNTALAQDEAKNGTRTLYSDVIDAMAEYGYGVDKLTPLSLGDILWDSQSNTFVLYKDGEEVMRDKGSSSVDKVNLWRVAKNKDDLSPEYSNYLADNFDNKTVSVKTGVDVGNNTVEVEYIRTTGDAQSVIFNTNGGGLTVNAPNDNVNHYGSASYVDIVAVANNSYHEFGMAAAVQVAQGRFVAESTAKVIRVHAAAQNITLEAKKGAVVAEYTKASTVSEIKVNGTKAEATNSDNIKTDSDEVINFAGENGVVEAKGFHFNDLQSALNVAKDGDIVKLLDNLVIDRTAVVEGKKLTLDMNGKTISNTVDIWENHSKYDWSMISVQKGAELTITGNGALSAKANDCYAVDIQDGSKCTIENGTFVGNIHAVYVLEGELTVNGGHFSIIQPNGSHPYGFLLNCYDANRENGTAKITVTGGTFERFNPADCWAEGEHTNFVADGYVVTSERIPNATENELQYTVVKAN